MRDAALAAALAAAFLVALPTGVPAAAAPAEPLPDPLALELDLARSGELYLLIDGPGGRIAVKVRGLALAEVPLAGLAAVVAAGAEEGPPRDLPRTWRVEAEPTPPFRRVLAPASLRTDEAGEGEADAAEAPAPEPPAEPPAPPAAYAVPLEGGWSLEVGPAVPGGGPLDRLAAAVAAGWRRLAGTPPPPDRRLVLALAPEDARRLYHTFRPGVALLVEGGWE